MAATTTTPERATLGSPLRASGHVIDELDDEPRLDAEAAIRAARVPSQFPEATSRRVEGTGVELQNSPSQAEFEEMELAGLEPATSWVRSRRSPN
jgi:hypothetical protein